MKTRRARCMSAVMLTLFLVGCLPPPSTFVAPTATSTSSPTPTIIPTLPPTITPMSGVNNQKFDVRKIQIERVLPLVNDTERFVGYETLIVNDNLVDVWINSATLDITATQYSLDSLCPSGVSGEVTAKYLVHLSAKGATTSTNQEGNVTLEQEIGGTIAEEDTDTKYRVEGSLAFTGDCYFTSWFVEINVPINVQVPAKGRARVQLLFSVDKSWLIEQPTRERTVERFTETNMSETDVLTLVLQGGYTMKTSIEGEMASFLINTIIENALEK